jgi:hypothetical protein
MSHDNLAHELAHKFCVDWMNAAQRKPKMDSDDKLERKIACFVLINNILNKAGDEK